MKQEDVNDVIKLLRSRETVLSNFKYLVNLEYNLYDSLYINGIDIPYLKEKDFENIKEIFVKTFEKELELIDKNLMDNNIVIE